MKLSKAFRTINFFGLAALSIVTFPAGGQAAGWLHTQGNHTYNEDGSLWLAHGVNINDMRANSQCWDGQVGKTDPQEVMRRLDLVAGWGANFIRIPMETFTPKGSQSSEIISNSNYWTSIKKIVDFATAKYPNMYILLTSWHDPTYDHNSLPTLNTDAVYQKYVDTFHSYSNIIFGIDNEPTFAPTNSEVWSAMNHAVQTIRNQEELYQSKPHLISVQSRGYSGDASFYISNPITANNGLNILYEVHIYDYRHTGPALTTAQNLPILVGEYGPGDPDANQGFDWETSDYVAVQNSLTLDQTSGFAAACRAAKIPILAWSFDEYDSPSMLKVPSGSPKGCNTNVPFFTTSWGAQIKAELATPYGLLPTLSQGNDTISAINSTIQISPSSVRADGRSFAQVNINLQTPFHKSVAGQQVSLTVSGKNNTLSKTAGTTDANGNFNANLTSTFSEQKTVSAVAGGVELVGSIYFNSLQQNTIALTPPSGSITANGVTVAYVYINANDQFGRPLANANISVTTSISDNTFQFSPTLDSNGAGWVRIHGNTPGYDIVTVSLGADSASTVVQVTTPYYAHIVTSPSSVPADGNSKIWMQVNYSSMSGAPGAGIDVLFLCLRNGATINPTFATTDAEGNVSASASYNVADTIQCTVQGGSDRNPVGSYFTFTPIGQGNYTVPERSQLQSVIPTSKSPLITSTASN